MQYLSIYFLYYKVKLWFEVYWANWYASILQLKAVLQFFYALKSSYETDLGQDLVLFNNKEILIYFSFTRSGLGIIRAHDLFTKTGTFLSHCEFIMKFNL